MANSAVAPADELPTHALARTVEQPSSPDLVRTASGAVCKRFPKVKHARHGSVLWPVDCARQPRAAMRRWTEGRA